MIGLILGFELGKLNKGVLSNNQRVCPGHIAQRYAISDQGSLTENIEQRYEK